MPKLIGIHPNIILAAIFSVQLPFSAAAAAASSSTSSLEHSTKRTFLEIERKKIELAQ